jgi:hypothetical protein
MPLVENSTDQEPTWKADEFAGYDVEALDGGIGTLDEASYDVGAGCIVIDTGPWSFGKKVLLPEGVISRVDHEAGRVHVNRTKDQIKNAPELVRTPSRLT